MIRFKHYLEEATVDTNAIASEIEQLAKKSRGQEKIHFTQMARDMKRTKKLPTKQHMNKMDDESREMILGLIYGHTDSNTMRRVYGVRM